jgi:hypothetical protein
MPLGYEHIKDKFISSGMSDKEAKKHAAMIWNAHHKGAQAVGRYT